MVKSDFHRFCVSKPGGSRPGPSLPLGRGRTQTRLASVHLNSFILPHCRGSQPWSIVRLFGWIKRRQVISPVRNRLRQSVVVGCSLHLGRDGYADTGPTAILVDEFKTSLLKKKNLGSFCQNDVYYRQIRFAKLGLNMIIFLSQSIDFSTSSFLLCSGVMRPPVDAQPGPRQRTDVLKAFRKIKMLSLVALAGHSLSHGLSSALNVASRGHH